MTTPFQEDEEDDELLADDITLPIEDDDDLLLDEDDDDLEITLDDVEELEEEENAGHRVQTYDPNDDGTDNYFDERYFDE